MSNIAPQLAANVNHFVIVCSMFNSGMLEMVNASRGRRVYSAIHSMVLGQNLEATKGESFLTNSVSFPSTWRS